MTQQNKNLEW